MQFIQFLTFLFITMFHPLEHYFCLLVVSINFIDFDDLKLEFRSLIFLPGFNLHFFMCNLNFRKPLQIDLIKSLSFIKGDSLQTF